MTTQNETRAGSLDTEFGKAGMVSIVGDPEMGTIYIRQVASVGTGPHSKIYFVGQSDHFFNGSFYVVGRLNHDGTRDQSFGTNGMVQGAFPGHKYANVLTFAILPDGKIVVEGMEVRPSITSALFARFEKDGALDPAFGENGFASITLDASTASPETSHPSPAQPRSSTTGVVGMQILPDGKILAHHYRGFILRLTPKGALDTDFNKTGFLKVVHPDYLPESGRINGILVRNDGKYVACGTLRRDNEPEAMFVCYDSTGELDKSFGSSGNGFVVIKGSSQQEGLGLDRLISQPNNRLLGIGATYENPYEKGLMISLESNGEPNIQFNSGQPLFTRLESDKRTLWIGGASQSDGKTVLAGFSGDWKTGIGVVARFISAKFDPDFGNGKGWIHTPDVGYATNLTLQDDGKIVVCTVPGTGTGLWEPMILRYLA